MRLTKPEREVVKLLGYAWDAFLELDPALDKHGFASAIHQAQSAIMARPTARHYQAMLDRWKRMKASEPKEQEPK